MHETLSVCLLPIVVASGTSDALPGQPSVVQLVFCPVRGSPVGVPTRLIPATCSGGKLISKMQSTNRMRGCRGHTSMHVPGDNNCRAPTYQLLQTVCQWSRRSGCPC